MSEYPFAGKENVLLDRMIYEGKIKYLLSQALGVPDAAELMGYTEQAYNWCRTTKEQSGKQSSSASIFIPRIN